MPIRFHCKRCQQLLGIASRKAGSEIQCPKCGIAQVVPSQEAAAAALAMTQFAKTDVVPDSAADLVVYDDEPSVIETPRPPSQEPAAGRAAAPPAKQAVETQKPSAAAASAPVASAPPGAEVAPPAGRPVPQGMILFPRRSCYVQGFLFVVLAAAAFGAGYLIGRGDATVEKQIEQEQAGKERILIEGKLVYEPGAGQIAGDKGAVVIALPDGKYPQKTLPIQGIRPQDPSPAESQRTVRMIRQLGGAYAKANAEGDFSMVVSQQGEYRLLIVSSHAARPQGVKLDEFDLAEMEKYFELADHLVNRFKYRWELKQINIGSDEIEVNFGRDGIK